MPESYTLRYQITPSAFQDAMRLHQATWVARLRTVTLLIALGSLLFAVAVDVRVGITVAAFNILIFASTWAQFIDRWLIARTGRGAFGGTCEFVVDDRGIHYQHPIGSGHLPWSALTTIRADDKSIIFRRDRVMAAYIPTAAFASPTDRDSFLAFVRRHVGTTGPSSDVSATATPQV